MKIMEILRKTWKYLCLACRMYESVSAGSSFESSKRKIAQGVRRFFEQNYELRYNVLKQAEEFRPRQHNSVDDSDNIASYGNNIASYSDSIASYSDCNAGWRQLTDRELRRMAFEQMEQVGIAWSVDVELYVRSALLPTYNPVSHYLEKCGQWDGKIDHIRSLARRVPCSCGQWPDWFHRWFLAMVAQWLHLSRDYGNSIVPLLTGGQGVHKSTFCKLILPPELREYYIDDIKLDSAEQVERMLGRMLLVNIDEYNAKTEREQAKIKRVLTERDVQTRRMRSDQYVMLPRMASFIGTTNDPQPLTDPTGSRRYLCCEVDDVIDTDTPIDYPHLYAQAVTELQQGASWHFQKCEEAQIERHNQRFRCQTSPETVLLTYFEPGERCKENFMRAVEIQSVLRDHLCPTDVPNVKTLTLALKSCGFPYGSYHDYRGWYCRPVALPPAPE